MPTFRRTAVTAALVGLLLPWTGVSAGASPRNGATQTAASRVGPADLSRLTALLAKATERAQALLDALDNAAAADDGLRVAYERAEQARAQAQGALDGRAREVYMASTGMGVDGWLDRFTAPDLA